MAQISMKDRAAAIKPVPPAPAAAAPLITETPAPVAPAAAGERAAARATAVGSTRRINFEVPQELHAAFKAWCAQHDTSMKDELEAHILRVLNTQ